MPRVLYLQELERVVEEPKGRHPVGIRIRGWEHSGEALTVNGGETIIENLGAFLSRYPVRPTVTAWDWMQLGSRANETSSQQ